MLDSALPILGEKGQGTVEAAFVLPILLGLTLLMIQPGIILYDRIVMEAAASEGCRLLAVSGSDFGDTSASVDLFIRHRLASIPPHELFHMHDGGCSWSIDLDGDEDAARVSVTIRNEIKPVPLLSWGLAMMGALTDSGTMIVSVEESAATQPDWARSTEAGSDVSEWAGAWSK